MKLSITCVLATAVAANAKGNANREAQRIVGGEAAPEGRFPYFAQYGGNVVCGSTLIHDDIVVGAAHCCVPSSCGLYFNSIAFREGTLLEVSEYILHPDYNYNTNENDIMLMKLSEAPSGISPIGYNTDSAVPADGQELTAIGFGDTTDGGEISEDLLQVTIDSVPLDECNSVDDWVGLVVEDQMFCAEADGVGTCQGDSGGPIFDAADGTGDLVGIVSWDDACAANRPSVLARVSHYEDWIAEGICCMSDFAPADCSCSRNVGVVEECSFTTKSDICGFQKSNPCLSPDATTLVETKGKVFIKDLVVGDRVMTASGQYKPVFTISHSHPNESTTFLRLQTNMKDVNPLELTPLHMLFLEGKHDPVPAKDVKIGDFLKTLHGPQEVINISVVRKNGFYNPVTTDGTIVVDGIIASTYTSLNGGSYFEIAGTKLMSFQSLFDMIISPYRTFCTIASFDVCNRLGGRQNDKPTVVHFMMQFYEFWLRQNVAEQSIIFVAFVVFFGLIRIMLSPTGIVALVGLIWTWYCYLSANHFTPPKNEVPVPTKSQQR